MSVDLIAPRTPGLIWVRGVVAGDEMVDGSLHGRRLRPLGLLWSAATRGGSRSTLLGAGRKRGIIGWWGRGGDRAKRSGDGGQRVGPEVAQDVKDGMSRALSGRVCRDLLSSGARGVPVIKLWSVRRPRVAIVMGLDQHRAQITADWLDTETGEVGRARLTPAHRDGVRQFPGGFAGRRLEVALEATTGWRFVVEELQAVGADVHLAEPAETSSLRGSKKRAKTDRAAARHLGELLMVGRLPEAWVPPAHLLDLRARVRLRHTLVDQRREWQQRIQAVLYHHGVPPRSWLLGLESRAWLAGLELPAAAREQITTALALTDGLDAQLSPLDRELRAFAKRQAGCRALMRHYGIGPLTSVTILAELGDARRFSSSREAVRYAGLDITVHQSDARRAPGHLSRQGPSALRWALFEAA